MEYRTVKFKKEHLEVMDLRPHEENLIKATGHLEALEEGVNVTVMVDGRVICCGGVIELHPGCANIWLIPSIHIEKATKTFVKGLREWLWSVREDMSLERMQSVCLDDELHNRWMSFLGFKKEGVMEKFCMGKDYVMFGRTKWE